jgi:hypothetical protein
MKDEFKGNEQLSVTSHQAPVVSAPVKEEKKEERSAPVKKEPKPVEKTCWIAHVKHMSGLPMRLANHRQGAERVVPCPPQKVEPIRSALRHFGMM